MHYFWGGGGSKSFSKYFFQWDSFLLLRSCRLYISFCLACRYVQISQSVDLFHCWLILWYFSHFLAIAKTVLLWTFLYMSLMSLLELTNVSCENILKSYILHICSALSKVVIVLCTSSVWVYQVIITIWYFSSFKLSILWVCNKMCNFKIVCFLF